MIIVNRNCLNFIPTRFFRSRNPETQPSQFLFSNCSGDLATVRRWIDCIDDRRYLDGIDTLGLGSPRYLCPQTVSHVIFCWILSGCSGGSRQPKYYSVRLLPQIPTGKRKGQPGFCLFGIPALFGVDLYDAAPGAFQKRCGHISDGNRCHNCRRHGTSVMDSCLSSEGTNGGYW